MFPIHGATLVQFCDRKGNHPQQRANGGNVAAGPLAVQTGCFQPILVCVNTLLCSGTVRRWWDITANPNRDAAVVLSQ